MAARRAVCDPEPRSPTPGPRRGAPRPDLALPPLLLPRPDPALPPLLLPRPFWWRPDPALPLPDPALPLPDPAGGGRWCVVVAGGRGGGGRRALLLPPAPTAASTRRHPLSEPSSSPPPPCYASPPPTTAMLPRRRHGPASPLWRRRGPGPAAARVEETQRDGERTQVWVACCLRRKMPPVFGYSVGGLFFLPQKHRLLCILGYVAVCQYRRRQSNPPEEASRSRISRAS